METITKEEVVSEKKIEKKERKGKKVNSSHKRTVKETYEREEDER